VSRGSNWHWEGEHGLGFWESPQEAAGMRACGVCFVYEEPQLSETKTGMPALLWTRFGRIKDRGISNMGTPGPSAGKRAQEKP